MISLAHRQCPLSGAVFFCERQSDALQGWSQTHLVWNHTHAERITGRVALIYCSTHSPSADINPLELSPRLPAPPRGKMLSARAGKTISFLLAYLGRYLCRLNALNAQNHLLSLSWVDLCCRAAWEDDHWDCFYNRRQKRVG